MFDHLSRYYNIETTTLALPDGRMVSYVRRRFLPPPAQTTSWGTRRPRASMGILRPARRLVDQFSSTRLSALK